MRVEFTARAQERLADIDAFLASKNPEHAAKTVEKLIAKGESLSPFPRRGRKVPRSTTTLFVRSSRDVSHRLPNQERSAA
jgi:plasmid stabilization system protein ParE